MTSQRARQILATKVDSFLRAFGDENIGQSNAERIVRKFVDYMCDEPVDSEETEHQNADS